MAQNEKSGAVKWLLIIAAVVLLVFICWKAGWILTGEKNNVSEQEKQEAIQETVQEINDELKDAQGDLREMQNELHEAADEIRDAFK